MNRSRIRNSAALVAAGAVLTLGQVALAGTANASEAGGNGQAAPSGGPSEKAVTPDAAPSTSGCPLNVVAPQKFYYNKRTMQVTDGGLYFGLENTGDKKISDVTFEIIVGKNLTFGSPTATGGDVTRHDSLHVTVHAGTVAGKGKLGAKIPTTLRKNVNSQRVNFAISSPDLHCAKPGYWTTNMNTHPEPTGKPTHKPTGKPTDTPTHRPTQRPTDRPSSPAPSRSAAPAPHPSANGGGGGKNLAETGANSNTPMLIGGAGALVVVGGGLALFASRRRRSAQG